MTSTGPPPAGNLLSSHFVTHDLQRMFAGRLGEDTCAAAARRFGAVWRRSEAVLGPVTAVRAVGEVLVEPLLAILGFRTGELEVDSARRQARARARPRRGESVPVLVTGWADDLDRCWRDAVRQGIASGSAWCYCCNARELRIVDAARPWGRHYLSFDLARCAADSEFFAHLWALGRADAVGTPSRQPSRALLEEVIAAAARARQAVCTGLERGVAEALRLLSQALVDQPRGERPDAGALLEQSLTVIYRLLFLLFAEARSLVPVWHPVYRDAYSVEALRDALEGDAGGVGLWPAIQAISRLAHGGCRLGTLRVTPFNGHLFSPDRAPLAEHAEIGDEILSRVLTSLTTTAVRHRSLRIAFADLGVEQLGAIYERVLEHRLVIDFGPAPARRRAAPAAVTLVAGRGSRKASATFYTPRALSDLIVRRTLGPLVEGVSADAILRLRVLDPAMGSGAFLVAACQYLARAYEEAIVREQQLRDHELDERDRAGFRRLVARRCLYGVDRNPMAVQLARLSLWLATLAADVPLTFLDHRLRVGDSLVGAGLGDLLRQPPGRSRRITGNSCEGLPLLAASDALEALDAVLPARQQLADLPDDTIAQVHLKERLLASLEARGAPLARWREAATLWCAAWFWHGSGPPPRGPVYADLLAAILGRVPSLPARRIETLLEEARSTAQRERFFHWTFEFPEVFYALGSPSSGGFDAVLGNPPWDMVRDDGDQPAGRPRALAAFVREAGIYGGAADAHANLYLLFVERAQQLLRTGGRLGLVVPWGLAADHGAARVRRALLDGCALDSWIALDNRHGLFPVHRSLRFLVFTGTRGRATAALPVERLPGDTRSLDRHPDLTRDASGGLVVLARDWLAQVGGDALAVPDVRSSDDVRLLDRLFRAAPALASHEGWAVRFGRELNASDDRDLLRDARPGMPVLEGKHVEPFRVNLSEVSRFAPESALRRRLPGAPFARSRVGYRDIASATNQRTLIAALIPAGTVTTHTLFCCRTQLDPDAQLVLCALLNSLVANWIVRRWVSTHVTVGLVERLPVPGPTSLGPWWTDLAGAARRLAVASRPSTRVGLEARLQVLAMRAWGVAPPEFDLVLRDFPLLDDVLQHAMRGLMGHD